ncbi:unnamed protein product, partial [Musa hybrid cultivar]
FGTATVSLCGCSMNGKTICSVISLFGGPPESHQLKCLTCGASLDLMMWNQSLHMILVFVVCVA